MSESSSPEVEEVTAGKPTLGPGERLQAARIEKSLTVQDIANQMHLSTAILEAIEENNFDEITAPIFVKGYIRAYARIVSLPEEELITQYSEFYSNEDPPISSTSNTVPEISTDDARIKWTTYLVIIVLIALLALWWWNKRQDRPDTVSLDANQPSTVTKIEEVADEGSAESEVVIAIEADSEQSEADQTDNQTLLPVDEESTEIIEPDQSGEALQLTTSSEEAVEEVLEEVEQLVEQEVIEEVAIEDNTPLTSNTDENLSTQELEVESSATTTTAAVTTAGIEPDSNRILRQAPNGDDQLVLKVNADTWADIKDSTDHRLVYDLLRAGQSMELVGKAPFRLFFGNGHGVELDFNQNSVDVAPNIRDDNTARMTVGN